MAKKSTNKKTKKKVNSEPNIGDKVLTVLTIVLIFLLIGLIISAIIQAFKGEADKKNNSEDEIHKAKIRLEEVNQKIEKLRPIRIQIKKTQWVYLLIARIVIAIILVGLNILFLSFLNWKIEMGELVNFNGAIVMGYTFFAFIMFGNPRNFVKTMKAYVLKTLRKRHIIVLTELEELEIEAKNLNMKIFEYESLLENDSKLKLD